MVLFAVGAWLIFVGMTLVAVRFAAAAVQFLLLLSTVGVGVLIYAAHSLP
jgi:hypothetical protein